MNNPTYNEQHSVARGKTGAIAAAIAMLTSLPALAQVPFFTPGNLVVSVEGNGVVGSSGPYGDNQAAPLTLFQFVPTGTASAAYVNSLVLPQIASGANSPVSGEYGSSSEGTLQLSGSGQYLTIMGYGVNAAAFNSNPNSYSPAPNSALGQSGSLTGQTYTPVPRVVTLIDANGNVNSSTALYNIFNTNNPRSTYTADGTNIYVSGQGTSGDNTGGVFYTTTGSSSATTITGDDGGGTESQDTRTVQIYNDTLYVSMDSKAGSYNRSYIGTLGDPPATSVFTCTGVGAGCPTGDGTIGPALMKGFGNTGGTGRVQLTGAETNGINVSGDYINLSPENYFFASPTVLYVADSGSPKNTSAQNETPYTFCGAGGLQKWKNVSGTWTWEYTLYQGLNLVANAACSSNTSGTTGLIGLTGVVVGSNVYLYATKFTIADLDPTYLYGITDLLSATTNPGQSFTLLAAAPPDSNFKGVSLAPTIPLGDVEITSSPSGLSFTSAGSGCAPGTYTTPVTLTWNPNSSCTLSVATTQTVAPGVQYAFTQWENETTSATTTDATFMVTAPSTTATYNATFAAVPVITWPPHAAIKFGSALSAAELDATASFLGTSVPGTFVYSPPAGTVLLPGANQTLSVAFTPTDTTDYTSATGTTTITVEPGAASGPADLVVTHVLKRSGGNVVVRLTIANRGGTAAANVVLTGVTVGSDSGTPLPQSLGTIPPGEIAQATVTVPGSVGAAGAPSSLTVSGTYTAGTFNSSSRITLP